MRKLIALISILFVANLTFATTLTFDIGKGKNVGYDESVDFQTSIVIEASGFDFVKFKTGIQYFDGCTNIAFQPEVYVDLFKQNPILIGFSVGAYYHIGLYQDFGMTQEIMVRGEVSLTVAPSKTTVRLSGGGGYSFMTIWSVIDHVPFMKDLTCEYALSIEQQIWRFVVEGGLHHNTFFRQNIACMPEVFGIISYNINSNVRIFTTTNIRYTDFANHNCAVESVDFTMGVKYDF